MFDSSYYYLCAYRFLKQFHIYPVHFSFFIRYMFIQRFREIENNPKYTYLNLFKNS